MVAPVSSSVPQANGLNELVHTQHRAVAPRPQSDNQQIAQAVLNKTPSVEFSANKNPPPPNLPRGSLLDITV